MDWPFAHFKISEFACKDGTPVPDEMIPDLRILVRNLEIIRSQWDHPVIIISGYRTPEYNARVGGAPASQHLLAKAADIRIHGMTPDEIATRIESLISWGAVTQGGLGIYADQDFVHYDIRGTAARWRG